MWFSLYLYLKNELLACYSSSTVHTWEQFVHGVVCGWLATGITGFAECQGHSAKPNLHSAKSNLSSAVLGKEHSANKPSAKAFLPSVFCRALGKAFAECPTLGKVGTQKNLKKWEKKGFFLNQWRPQPASARPSPAFFA